MNSYGYKIGEILAELFKENPSGFLMAMGVFFISVALMTWGISITIRMFRRGK